MSQPQIHACVPLILRTSYRISLLGNGYSFCMPSKYDLQDYIAASLYLADSPVTARNLGIYLDLPLEIVHQNIQDLRAKIRGIEQAQATVGIFAQSEQNQNIPIANLLGRAISGLVDFARTGRTPDLLVSLAGPELVAYQWMTGDDVFVYETNEDGAIRHYGLGNGLDLLIHDLNAISESKNSKLAALNESFAEIRRLRGDPESLAEADRDRLRENTLKSQIIEQEWLAFESRTTLIRHLILFILARTVVSNLSLLDKDELEAIRGYIPQIDTNLPTADRYLALAFAIGCHLDDDAYASLLKLPVAEIALARQDCQKNNYLLTHGLLHFVQDKDNAQLYCLRLHPDLEAEFGLWQEQRKERAQTMLKEKLELRSNALEQLVAAIQKRCVDLAQDKSKQALVELLQSELPDLEGALKENSVLMKSLDARVPVFNSESKNNELIALKLEAIDGVIADFASLIDLHEQQTDANKKRLKEARLIDEAGLARSIEHKLDLLIHKTQALKNEARVLQEQLERIRSKIIKAANHSELLSIASAPAVQCHLAMSLSRAFFEQTNAYKSLDDLREIASRRMLKNR